MEKKKNKIKVVKAFGDPDAPINEISRHMRQGEMRIINNQLQRIWAIIAVIFEMAEGDLLGDQSEGLRYILDNALSELDDLRRKINGETVEEEEKRIREEKKAA